MAYQRCPLAAVNGYLPEHPRSDLTGAKNFLDGWPLSSARLDWVHGTRFGLQHAMNGYASPPPAIKGTWIETPIGYEGLFYYQNTRFRFLVQALFELQNGFEIVLVDMSSSPPDRYGWESLAAEALFVQKCFSYLTERPAFVYLIAPVYQHEHLYNIPQQSFIPYVATLEYQRLFSIMKPGTHCFESRGQSWACPLRRRKQCNPYP